MTLPHSVKPQTNESGCCGSSPPASSKDAREDRPWVIDQVDTAAGQVPRVTTELSRGDRLGAIRVRLNILRMRYAIEPGLYAVGHPTPASPVLVSANYKLSFDSLRKELGDLAAWIVVLDTRGINVWCAAGKGTFSTDELVHRIAETQLAKVVSHRTLVVPQLGAPGVAAHEVKKRSGFRVVYGPVRARDLPAFFEAGLQATSEMRRVRFELLDRLAVIPVEVVQGIGYVLFLAACFFLLAGLSSGGYDSTRALAHGSRGALLVVLSFIGGGVVAPVLLPWLPGRAFSIKGATIGLLLGCGLTAWGLIPAGGVGARLELASWLLMMPAMAAFVAMNFTGASTYTSLSGVRREMRFAVPAQLAAGAVGFGLWLAARFF